MSVAGTVGLLLISVAPARADVSISAGAGARLRYETVENPGWNPVPAEAGYLLTRFMLHAELELDPQVRLFAEVKSGLETGRDAGPRPTDKDELDVHQAYLELSLPSPDLELRLGRQELAYGASRLISVREGPNVRRTFDGARLRAHAGSWQVDAFVVAPVETNPGVFDDGDEDGQYFWGLYGTGPVLSWLNVDAYLLSLHNRDARFEEGTGEESRYSGGTRLWGKGAGWDYDFELVYQWGSFGTGSIRAWTTASNSGYSVGPVRFGLKANATSGDDDPKDPDLQTFNPLFPRGSYFGEASLIGPLNHIDLDPSVDLHLGRDVSILADVDCFWRESLADGLYGTSGGLQVPGAGNPARYVGTQTSLTAEWKIDRHATLTAAYAHFFAGPFLGDAGRGHDIDFAAVWVQAAI